MGISIVGLISFCIFTETLRSSMYERILDSLLLPYYEREYVFQQYNSPIHNSKSITKFLNDNNVDKLDWPPYSPDLNPIENLWHIIKEKLSHIIDINFENIEANIEKILSEMKYKKIFNIISNI